jgi:hypothetical protein
MEALWKPRAPGSDPRRSAGPPSKREFIDKNPDSTRSRPRSLGLCKQEVTGSIPVGSTDYHAIQIEPDIGERHVGNREVEVGDLSDGDQRGDRGGGSACRFFHIGGARRRARFAAAAGRLIQESSNKAQLWPTREARVSRMA